MASHRDGASPALRLGTPRLGRGRSASASVAPGNESSSEAHDREILRPASSSPLSTLLPFQRSIIRSLVPAPDESLDEGDALLIMSRGLGMSTIVASILRIYDGPNNLVLVINATQDEEAGLGEELTTMGVRKPGLRTVSHETSAKARQELYLSGGLLSVTSRILVVDMLHKRVPTEMVTGIIVLHAEQISPTTVEAFIARIYRRENKDGFMKAFSDHPEHFAIGLIPLQTVLGQLRIRKVELWPRFHKQVIKDLGQRKADVVELQQPLSRSMRKIQNAIVECLDATLGELKRGSGQVDVEDATLENAIFRQFDYIVRRQLDPVWHRLGFKTKQLVADLSTLRTLLTYLLNYDAVEFNTFLETVLVSQTNQTNNNSSSGTVRQNQSPWLFMDAANTIFIEAKARVYIGDIKKPEEGGAQQQQQQQAQEVIDVDAGGPDEDEFEAAFGGGSRSSGANGAAATKKTTKPWWLPPGIEPVLEELPKWHLLRDVLDEIEQEIHFTSTDLTGHQNNTILIMTESAKTAGQLRDFLSRMEGSTIGVSSSDEVGEDGEVRLARKMMERRLKDYFFWKGSLGAMSQSLKQDAVNAASTTAPGWAQQQQQQASSSTSSDFQSAALKRKDFQRDNIANKRRRQRGGSAAARASGKRTAPEAPEELEKEAGDVADFINSAMRTAGEELGPTPSFQLGEGDDDDDDADADDGEVGGAAPFVAETFTQVEFESFFGLLSTEDLVVVRSYRADEDDKVLQELRPRFVVMYDPDPAFVRRLEIYRSMHAAFGVRVYFLMYAESVEEQRYLSSLRREKESFERLIREKATMALPMDVDGRPAEQTAEERLLRTINSRIAGGQRTATSEPPRVVVDMREFRSSLPSMLDAAGMHVIPCTLQVGDYVLTSTMCVERKSLSDLVQSFNSGRLYTQAELMSIHYQHPILLIEFDQEKSFSLQSLNETKTGNPRAITSRTKASEVDIQSKLVLLTTAFPRLRIIWSSSPYATADIFAELKQNFDEPDLSRVAAVGLDELGPDVAGANNPAGGGFGGGENTFNLTPQDVLLALPGITTKNFRYVMSSVRDLAELCDLDLDEVQEIVGVEPGKRLHGFLTRDVKGDRSVVRGAK